MTTLLRTLVLAALSVGAAALLTSCDGDGNRESAEAPPLTIGYLGALTGGFAETADEIRNIIALAVERVNEAVVVRDVRLVVGDTALNAEQGLPISYEGGATSLDWDAQGDVLSGSISIWQYEDGDIVELAVVPVDLE